MRDMRIQKQFRLSFRRTVEICVNGIYYRLFRSLVTVAIVSVAIAFMMYMLGGSVIGKSIHRNTRTEAQRYKMYDRWLSWIEERLGRRALFQTMANCEENDPKIRAMKRWGALSDEQMHELVAVSREARKYLRFFDELSPGKLFLLAPGSSRESVLAWLSDEQAFEQFADRLSRMGSVRLPGSTDELQGLLDTYSKQLPLWIAIEKGRNEAIRRFHEHYPDRKAADLLASPPPDLAQTLVDLGFADSGVDLSPIYEDALAEKHLKYLSDFLRRSVFKRDIGKRAGVNPVLVNMAVFGKVYLSRGGADFVEESLGRNDLKCSLDRETVRQVFRHYLRRSRILGVESGETSFSEGFLGFSGRTLWLIGVSFVVCIVGIANAMLMSVMERFREIATMKCLGATDSFVMALFVLESCTQGVVGGAAGAVLGLLLAVPFSVLRYGGLVWGMFPSHDILISSLVAIGTGVALAAIASVYPAHVAAKLVPMEAMRVE